GASIGHVSPEAMEGGPIALVEDGDMIVIDIRNKEISVRLTEEDLKKRFSHWKPPEPRITSGYMSRYAKSVSSASEGAVIK
ncbi:MAG: dihydroxy-acid dehydratase, partial [Pseudomonadota bacterium]